MDAYALRSLIVLSSVRLPRSDRPVLSRFPASVARFVKMPTRSTACIAILFVAAASTILIETRPFKKSHERFIGHGDEADLALVARNIAEGNGAVTDCVWILHAGGRPGNQVRQAEGYWSIYVAGIIAPFFTFFGSSRTSLLLAASLVKTTISFIAFFWTKRLAQSNFAALASGLILLTHPSMTSRVAGLSDIYLTLFMFLSSIFLCEAIANNKWYTWLASGGMAGLAVGAKPSGLIMLGVTGLSLLFLAAPRRIPKALILGATGFIVTVMPLAVHNYRAGGTVVWPDFGLISSTVRLRDFGTADWNDAAYDPSTSLQPKKTILSSESLRVRMKKLQAFVKAFVSEHRANFLWLLPFYASALCVLVTSIFSNRNYPNDSASIFMIVSVFLLLGGLVLGTSVHTDVRYWNFLVPPITIIGICDCCRRSKLLVVVSVLISLVMGGWWYGLSSPDIDREHRYVAACRDISKVIPKSAVVMTSNPWEFSFHTRHLSVMMPVTDREDLIESVARRYGAEYLVVIDGDVRHPAFKELGRGIFPDFLDPVYHADGVVIGRFRDLPGFVAP